MVLDILKVAEVSPQLVTGPDLLTCKGLKKRWRCIYVCVYEYIYMCGYFDTINFNFKCYVWYFNIYKNLKQTQEFPS